MTYLPNRVNTPKLINIREEYALKSAIQKYCVAWSAWAMGEARRDVTFYLYSILIRCTFLS